MPGRGGSRRGGTGAAAASCGGVLRGVNQRLRTLVRCQAERVRLRRRREAIGAQSMVDRQVSVEGHIGDEKQTRAMVVKKRAVHHTRGEKQKTDNLIE